jgi:hypothetical protein
MTERYSLRQTMRYVALLYRYPLTFLIVICGSSVISARLALADSPTSRPSPKDLATPRDTLIAYDHWCVDLQDIDDTAGFYSATTDQEKAYVQQCVRYTQIAAKMERLLRKSFGPENCTTVMHEYGDADVPDLRSAAIIINGNVATVSCPQIQFQCQMVKVGDIWLIDAGYLMRAAGGLDAAVQASNNIIAILQPIADDLQSGKFKSAQEVVHALDQNMQR